MSKHEPIKVKGHNFLRECHFPMYWLARMREMRIGECICDYGIASGLINFDKSRSAI